MAIVKSFLGRAKLASLYSTGKVATIPIQGLSLDCICTRKSMEGLSAMRAVVQRVKRAEARVSGEVVGRIGFGFVILLGVGKDDTEASGEALAEKIANLRVFDDGQGKLNVSLLDSGGHALCVSQFTLYGDCRKGRRPSYDQAAPPERASLLYERFVESLGNRGIPTATGRFRANMELELVNDGPVTLLVDSDRLF